MKSDAVLKNITELISAKSGGAKALANYLGISPQTVTDWKKGKSHSYMQMLPQISEYYGVQLIDGTKTPTINEYKSWALFLQKEVIRLKEELWESKCIIKGLERMLNEKKSS